MSYKEHPDRKRPNPNKVTAGFGRRIAKWAGGLVVGGVIGLGVNYVYNHYVEGVSDVPRPPIDGECTGSKLDSLKKIDEDTYEAVGMLAGRSCTYVFDNVTGIKRATLEVGDTLDLCDLEGPTDREGVSFTARRYNGYVELTENAQHQVIDLKPRVCNPLNR